MKKFSPLFFFLLIAANASTFANYPMSPMSPMSLPQNQPSRLVINNRILAKVNGKTISVIDVRKQMDMFLNRNYPKQSESLPAKFQFYSTHWKEFLGQMIDTELMLAHAVEKEIKVSEGDVRETLQERLGPNVMASLDKLHLTYDEARKMIHDEMIVERMTWFKVNSKAYMSISSQDIKAAYNERFSQNLGHDTWKYQVLSIRANNALIGQQVADKAYELLAQKKLELAAAAEKIKSDENSDPTLSLAISQDYEVPTKALSQSHKEVLLSLKPNSYSAPIAQVSRVDKSTVYRIFYLKEHKHETPPAFTQIEDKIKDELLQKEIAKESNQYLTRLRNRFGYNQKNLEEDIPADFVPFSLE